MQLFLSLIKFRQKPLNYALSIGASFLVLCSFYIWVSGELAAQFAHDISDLKNFELYKGLTFVALTSLLIFVMCFVFFKKLSRDAEDLLKGQEALLLAEHKCAAGVFASCMAHDANNVLAVISLRAEQLKLLVEPESEAMPIVDKLGTSIDKLIGMMTKLKNSGSTNLGTPIPFDFKRMVNETMELVSHHKSLSNSEVEFVCNEDTIPYVGYSVLFQQMLINLILNAAEAPRSASTNRILITLNQDAHHITLNVEDNGTGISEFEKEKIFTAFYTTKKTGSGLGLLSVKACVDQHLGEMSITSSPSLGGALFRITLPKSV